MCTIKSYKSFFYALTVALLIGVITAVYFFVIPIFQTYSKRAIYNYPESINQNGLNFIFYADKYENKEAFSTDINTLITEIKTVQPWKNYDYFNVYSIYPKNDICYMQIENERKPVLRCKEEINKYLEVINKKYFKLIVLSRREFQSWANVARLNNSGIFFSVPKKITESEAQAYGYLLDHLLGHAFGLKDEEQYVIAKAGGEPHAPNGPNCAPNLITANAWWGDLAQLYPERVGYFNTCAGNQEYIRPTQGSFMNFGELEYFVPDYGPVSERYLTKVINYCFSSKKYSYKDDKAFFDLYPEFKECLIN